MKIRNRAVQKNKYNKLLAGFTVIELLVSISIILALTTLLFASYREGQKDFQLQKTAYKLAQDIMQVKEWAMNGKKLPDNSLPAGGYGIYIEESSSSYVLFASSTENPIETIFLEKGINFSTTTPAPMTIVFMPPDPIVSVNNVTGSNANATITLFSSLNNKYRIITVNSRGLIEIKK